MENRSGCQRQRGGGEDCYIMHGSGLDEYGSCGNDEEGWGFEQNLKIEPVGFPDALYVECELRMTTRFLAQGGKRKFPISLKKGPLQAEKVCSGGDHEFNLKIISLRCLSKHPSKESQKVGYVSLEFRRGLDYRVKFESCQHLGSIFSQKTRQNNKGSSYR